MSADERRTSQRVHHPRHRGLLLGLALLALVNTACNESHPTIRLPDHLSPFVVTTSSLSHDPLSLLLAAGRKPEKPDLSTDERTTLARYLATLATVGPTSTPELFSSETDELAYLVNAHVGWTLALHDEGGLAPEGLDDIRRVPVPLDRGRRTLEALEEQLVGAALHQPRIVLCLNPGLAGGPPLPAAALAGHAFDWQLRDHALRCGRTPGFWELSPESYSLRVSAFTAYVPGLADQSGARMQQLLELIPPPPELRAAVDEVCGPTLSRCQLGLVPLG